MQQCMHSFPLLKAQRERLFKIQNKPLFLKHFKIKIKVHEQRKNFNKKLLI